MRRLKSLMNQFKAQMSKLEAQIDPYKAIQKQKLNILKKYSQPSVVSILVSKYFL